MLDLMESEDLWICDVGPRYADVVRNFREHSHPNEPARKSSTDSEIHPRETSAAEACKHALEARAKAHIAASAIAFNLECFGDELARRMKYKEHAGMDAIHFYLVEKYHWLPSQVQSLHPKELWWLLREEKSGWVAPALRASSAPAEPKA